MPKSRRTLSKPLQLSVPSPDTAGGMSGSKPTVLVTGAAGFIGSHAAEAFIDRGYPVVGVDNFCNFYDRSWKEMNLKCAGPSLRIEELDITDGPRISALIA